MPPFLEFLSEKLLERWLGLLLPGAIFVATVVVAVALGQGEWAGLHRLIDAGDRAAADWTTRSGIATAVLIAGAVSGAAAAGAVARAAGAGLRLLWTEPWPGPLRPVAVRRTAARARRWRALNDAYEKKILALHRGEPVAEQDVRDLALLRNGIAQAEPSRPTWMGDRLAAVEARVHADYGLDLAAAWPRLWLLLPEDSRASVRYAVAGLDSAAVLCGWGLLYLGLGAVWWPAAVLGASLGLAGWVRARRAAEAYADLTESVVDLNLAELARRLEITGKDLREIGENVSSRLRKGS